MTEDPNAGSGPDGSAPVPPVTSSPTAAPPPVPPPVLPPSAPRAPEPPPTPDDHRRRGGGVTAGIVLILVGLALLLAQFVPGLSLWQLWPLFIIVPGLVQCFMPGKDGWSAQQFFDGLVTVTIGGILLANTTGYLPWDVWWEIVQLWPVLLISAGLAILGRATRQSWVRALGTAVVLIAFAYAVSVSYSGVATRWVGAPAGESFSFTQPVSTDDEPSLTLKAGVGEIVMGGTAGRRVAIQGVSPFGPPSFVSETAGGTTDVTFELTSEDSFVTYPGAPTARVEALLSEWVPWEVTLDTGVSSLEADLSGVPLSRLELKTGVSSNTIKIGDPPLGPDEGRVIVKSGVSSVKILVPSDAEVRVESDSGLTSHAIDDSLESLGGGRWETPGFSAAQQAGEPVWIISASSGLGSVAVSTY